MFRNIAMPTATLLGLPLLAPMSAHATVEVCHGQAVTLVGASQTFEAGRDGGAGRDCEQRIRGRRLSRWKRRNLRDRLRRCDLAGEVDDLIDGSSLKGKGVQVGLGAGNDRFIGGAAFDVVWGGTSTDGFAHTDGEADVIDTGPAASNAIGADSVTSGQAGQPNADVIRMGRGNLRWDGVPADGGMLNGGVSSSIRLSAAATDEMAADNLRQTVNVTGRPTLRSMGFTDFYVLALDGSQSLSFVGSSRDEKLTLELSNAPAHTAEMGGGDDEIHLYSSERHTASSGTTYNGGSGRDELRHTLPDEVAADVDLRRGRLSLGRPRLR